MVKSAEDRINKYAAKISGDVAKNRIDAQRGFMISQEKTATENLVTIEEKVKAHLAHVKLIYLPKPLILLIPYYIIAVKEIDKVFRTYKSSNRFGTGMNEAGIIYNKWLARGLDPITLKDVIMCALNIKINP